MNKRKQLNSRFLKSYLRFGFSAFYNHLRDMKRIKERHSRIILSMRSLTVKLYNQCLPLSYASKHSLYLSSWQTQALQKLFNQLKVNWALKYCTLQEPVGNLNPRLRTFILRVIDNRKQLMPFGKFKNNTFNHFYKNSTAYHKQYFTDIQNPDDTLKPVQEYITSMLSLSKAGYFLDIPL